MQKKMNAYYLIPKAAGAHYDYRKVKIPKPERDQVLIKVKAIGVNRGEIILIDEFSTRDPRYKPMPAGIEYSGEIVALGPDATGWHIGERVMGRGMGALAEYMLSPLSNLMIRIPDGMSYEEAASIPNIFITAYDALMSIGDMKAGENVMVTAASSGIGIATIQLAKMFGAGKVIATGRGDSKAQQLLDIGATDYINSKEDGFANQVRDLTGGDGAGLIIDVVGGPMLPDNIDALKNQGRLVSVGRNGGDLGELDMNLLATKRIRIIGATFRTRRPEESYTAHQLFVQKCLPGFVSGELRPIIDRTFKLNELKEAHMYMAKNAQVGKILIVND